MNKNHPAFVILFTILISTIILMIGLGIFSIATRETVLSGTAREAQYAFYAADAGVECALYAQSHGVLMSGGTSYTFECGSATTTVTGSGQYPSNPFVFNVIVDPNKKTCAKVTIFDVVPPSGGSARRVISQGYNVCDVATGKPMAKNPLLVERDLDVTYETGTVASPTGIPITPLPSGVIKNPIGSNPPLSSINPNLPFTPVSQPTVPSSSQKTVVPNGQ